MNNLEKIEIYKRGIYSQFVDEEFKEQMRDRIRELQLPVPFYPKDEIKKLKNSFETLKNIFPSLKQNDKGYYIPSIANDDKYIIKKAKENGVDIEIVNRYNDGTGLYDVYINLSESKFKKEKADKISEQKAKEHAETFERIKKGEIQTAEDLGQSISNEHSKKDIIEMIEALNISLEFSEDIETHVIITEIEALKISLDFI